MAEQPHGQPEEIKPHVGYKTKAGTAWHGDARDVLGKAKAGSAQLILTSPPFALTRTKSYGNEPEDDYLKKWFPTFIEPFKHVLADDGSLVIDLGGAWTPGDPVKSLYQFRLLIALVDDHGFHLAQDFVWFNRAKLPGPRQWTTIDRVRVKDAVNHIWWLSKSPNPKADNRRVLRPYSNAMLRLLKRGTYNGGQRPAEHFIGENWAKDLGGAIPPNVIEVANSAFEDGVDVADTVLDYANTRSRELYHDFCYENFLDPHPARFPRPVVEFFVKFLTEPGELVVDPFGGSNVTGEVAEQFGRKWLAVELDQSYLAGSIGRFSRESVKIEDPHLKAMALGWPTSGRDSAAPSP